MEQMFLGEFQYAIDDKGRLTIPAKFRKPLLEGMVITRGLDHNLAIYPLDAWKSYVEQVNGLPIGAAEARNFRRLIFSSASDVEPDRQGRINIPSYLLDFAEIGKEVVVAGMLSFIELWSPERWRAVQEALEHEDNADRWASLNI